MAQSISPIRILAQPQQSHRERYNSELDPKRNRPNRFIRADPNEHNYEHPTIEILSEWSHKKNLYIRVTLATVPTEQVPLRCVHPYSINAEENTENVIIDIRRNALYFPITDDDFVAGHKSFRITRKKSVQHDLKNYGPLRIIDTDQDDIPRLDDPTDARKLIDVYQLGKSQLIFSLAELVYENQLPVIYGVTTVCSNVMVAMSATQVPNFDESPIKCVPRKGAWEGSDEVLMVIPRIDRRRPCRIVFEHSSTENVDEIIAEFVDNRTISFFTPPCPVQSMGQQTVEVPLIVVQGNEEIARVNFLYQSWI